MSTRPQLAPTADPVPKPQPPKLRFPKQPEPATFFHIYYIAHALLFASYFYTRFKICLPIWQELSSDPSQNLISMNYFLSVEKTIWGSMSLFALHSWFNRLTVASFLTNAFTFLKFSMLSVYFITAWKLFSIMIIQWMIIAFFIPIPDHTMLAPIYWLSNRTFFFHILGYSEPTQSKPDFKPTRSYWLVNFYAPWAYHSQQFSPIFSQISNTYKYSGLIQGQKSDLRFGKLDLSLYPEIASLFTIDMRATKTYQIPTLILFCDGREISRFPPLNEGKFSKKFDRSHFLQKNLKNHFQLSALEPPSSK